MEQQGAVHQRIVLETDASIEVITVSGMQALVMAHDPRAQLVNTQNQGEEQEGCPGDLFPVQAQGGHGRAF
jgi:hypothetical protein